MLNLFRDLNYNGVLPDYTFWPGMPYSIYLEYVEMYKFKPYNLMIEAIYYCKVDCVSLFAIL